MPSAPFVRPAVCGLVAVGALGFAVLTQRPDPPPAAAAPPTTAAPTRPGPVPPPPAAPAAPSPAPVAEPAPARPGVSGAEVTASESLIRPSPETRVSPAGVFGMRSGGGRLRRKPTPAWARELPAPTGNAIPIDAGAAGGEAAR